MQAKSAKLKAQNKEKKQDKINRYQPSKIESKWQDEWRKMGLYNFDLSKKGEKYYVLVELPYPSGDLHIGHWFTFVTPDVLARFKTMNGENVFFPMGYDAFGLPAENAAIKRKVHPQDWTMSNIDTMTKQFQTMGTMMDWNNVTITCLPEYYRWNQWIFIKMFERGIAYRSKTLSNWCPVDQTVLANEHVENGRCWRCGTEVVQKEVEQWFLKITEYADRLLWDNTDANKLSNGVDWPKSVREGQNNWIGKSEGVVIKFLVDGMDCEINVFTTRPDTLFGATFLVLSPEHPLVSEITQKNHSEDIQRYQKESAKKSELERKEMKEKTGVFTGAYATNPVNNEKIPVWIADYVLMGYGTGAIMAVPAHDTRDFEFAKKYDLPIRAVISSSEAKKMELPYVENGEIINSDEWNGWKVPEQIEKVIDWLEEKGMGIRQVEYHLHDWSVSRQRYWGTPVPMVHCDKCGIVPVPLEELPVELPYNVDYTPKGKPPLASNEEWLRTTCPKCGGEARRDAETLDTFFDSSWYFFRYVDPSFKEAPFDQKFVKKLLPVDIYFGGAEHTLGHTLYARFFTKFFKDLNLVEFEEFAKKRVQHGIVLGPDGNKMSKSRGNVINPDDVVREYGADAVRLYLCFMMPYEASGPWSTGAMSGVYRFLRRVWELYGKVQLSGFSSQLSDSSQSVIGLLDSETERQKTGKLEPENREPRTENRKILSQKDLYQMHRTIQKVTDDISSVKMNTAVAALMEWLNYLSSKSQSGISIEEYKTFLLLLAPFAPHMAEELWHQIEKSKSNESSMINYESIHSQSWPKFDKKYLESETVTIVIQVNGKHRGQVSISSNIKMDQKSVEKAAKDAVQKYLEEKNVKKVVYVPGKIINFVV